MTWMANIPVCKSFRTRLLRVLDKIANAMRLPAMKNLVLKMVEACKVDRIYDVDER